MTQEGKSIVGTRERPERLQEGRVADLDADEPTAKKHKQKKPSLPFNLFKKHCFFQYLFTTNAFFLGIICGSYHGFIMIASRYKNLYSWNLSRTFVITNHVTLLSLSECHLSLLWTCRSSSSVMQNGFIKKALNVTTKAFYWAILNHCFGTMCSLSAYAHTQKTKLNNTPLDHHSPKCMCVLSGSERVFLRMCTDFSISSFKISLPRLDWIWKWIIIREVHLLYGHLSHVIIFNKSFKFS